MNDLTINERFFHLLEESQYTQKELSQHTKISEKTLSAWKRRGTDPPARYISAIAEFLSCSEHFLLTGEKEASPAPIAREKNEEQLLDLFRQLDAVEQGLILGRAAQLLYQKRQERQD